MLNFRVIVVAIVYKYALKRTVTAKQWLSMAIIIIGWWLICLNLMNIFVMVL